jgi:hypothetical protein
MKKFVFSLLLGLAVIAPLGVLVASLPDYTIRKVSIEYGQKRPFSFYYPYSYQYYYPRPEYYQSSRSCYWLYTNGTYVYTCN